MHSSQVLELSLTSERDDLVHKTFDYLGLLGSGSGSRRRANSYRRVGLCIFISVPDHGDWGVFIVRRLPPPTKYGLGASHNKICITRLIRDEREQAVIAIRESIICPLCPKDDRSASLLRGIAHGGVRNVNSIVGPKNSHHQRRHISKNLYTHRNGNVYVL